ncbi:MAG: hypothetical protein U1F43_04295 [Myxococcota bacterium]
MKKLALVLGTALPLAATTGTAMAKDMKGRFGAGVHLADLGGVPGSLSLKYWVSDLGIQALLGLSIKGDDGDTPGDESSTGFGLGLRLLFNFARANDTNMYGGAGVRLGLIDADATIIDLVLGIEHFFTDYFSVGVETGLAFDVGGSATNITLGPSTAPLWGASAHFYF